MNHEAFILVINIEVNVAILLVKLCEHDRPSVILLFFVDVDNKGRLFGVSYGYMNIP